jgi:RNA polymerase sigma-70 factor, ECF subfamily
MSTHVPAPRSGDVEIFADTRNVSADAEDFVARLRRGDQSAFRTLIAQHHAGLVRLARSFCKIEATAEEVVQDAWLAVVTGLDSFTADSPLRSWIAAIVVNKAKTRAVRDARVSNFSDLQSTFDGEDTGFDPDRFASDGAWLQPPQHWQGVTPERIVAGRQLAAHVGEQIELLPPNQRAVVLLRDVQGLDPKEICATLQISEGHLRVLLHRARTRLRAAVDGLVTPPAAA